MSETKHRPIQLDTTPVKVCGEPLHPIWWRGKQWAVTEYGVEALDGTYSFEAKRLTENIENWGWPAHVREKDWVDRGIRDGMTRGPGATRREGDHNSDPAGTGSRVRAGREARRGSP